MEFAAICRDLPRFAAICRDLPRFTSRFTSRLDRQSSLVGPVSLEILHPEVTKLSLCYGIVLDNDFEAKMLFRTEPDKICFR